MIKSLIAALIFPCILLGQTEKNPCETLSKINSLIQNFHYKPKPIDDSLSVYVFKTFLNRLDEDNRLFIEPEVKALEKHQYKIDDYLNNNSCGFLDDFYLAYTNTTNRYKRLLENIKKETFPLSSNEQVQFSRNAFPYAKDEKELQHLYKKRLLFNVLREVAELSTNKDSLVRNFDRLAMESKANIFDKFECKAEAYVLTKAEFYNLFFSTFCSYFDPHTDYFSESDKSSFYATVSSDNMTFGFYMSMSEKDEMTVEEIIPGSSAYFSEKIDKGDQLLKVTYQNNEYHIACSSMKKIEEIITSKEYTTADFTFRKKSGEIYSVRLNKKVMKDYQNNVYSFKLKKGNDYFGYIRIPSFYATFENGKSSVSNDVAKEVYKLEGDGVSGIIIDIQNNGGGSMEEAVKLSGLFIDVGPLAVMSDGKQKREMLKDQNRGTIYNGPMIVMINGFSASASEFFANAMQDYNRAIIVGNRSLGKASMQRIIPIDDQNQEFVKLTLEKFYRITGKSNQYVGITPDVEIPLLFDKQMPREDSNKTALKNELLNISLKYNRLANDELKSKLIQSSQARIQNNDYAKKVNELNAKINPLFDGDLPPITLQFSAVFEDVNKMNSLWKTIKTTGEIDQDIVIIQNTVDLENQKFDEYLKSTNLERSKEIKQNYHIAEALNILYDSINLKP
ncbi:MAG: S41 family peptidase [Flavobacterium sp.]|uniref:S41 family peptidase n=1 Tax=Flavobacterium sp. TaxID=239 RepID=UPI0039199A85